jgi:hypothetical protein
MVPISPKQLEDLVLDIARDLLESWAIADRFNQDQMEEAAQHAVDDSIFVVNAYMTKFNELVSLQQTEQTKPKLITE